MSLLTQLCVRQRAVEAVRRNAAQSLVAKEASKNRIHATTSPVPASHAGEESKVDVGTPAEQLSIVLRHWRDERTFARRHNIFLPDLMRLKRGQIEKLPNEGQSQRLEKSARALLK